MQHSTFPKIPETAADADRQDAMLATVADRIADLNAAVCKAVEAGVSIELQRSARHHCGGGNWGDLMMPVVIKRG